MKFSTLQTLAYKVQNSNAADIVSHIDDMLLTETGKHWVRDLNKLRATVGDDVSRFSIFALDGNKKLPFVSFATLPGVTCPGAGDCLEFCYSFKAWRYPAAFCRQAQNTYLMRYSFHTIAAEFERIAAKPKFIQGFTVRLYTDGDFSSVMDVNHWFELCERHPNVSFYGYSKSFNELLQADIYPSNYMLNLSSGHNSADYTVGAVEQLPITRGHFKAVNVGYTVRSNHHADKEHQRHLRKAYQGKAFTCPGTCGDCTPTGHACGSERFKNVDIIIAVH